MTDDVLSRARKLAKEYRPSMDRDIVHAWAADVVALLRELAGGTDWIEWDSTDCPVPPGTKIEWRFRNGHVGITDKPETWRWGHTDQPGDIVAYRVLE